MTTRYTKDHEYIRVEGDTGTVGITDYAQSQLGDVVYVELPTVGKAVWDADSHGQAGAGTLGYVQQDQVENVGPHGPPGCFAVNGQHARPPFRRKQPLQCPLRQWVAFHQQ